MNMLNKTYALIGLMMVGAMIVYAGCPGGVCGMSKPACSMQKAECSAEKASSCSCGKADCKKCQAALHEAKPAEKVMAEISTETLEALVSSGAAITLLDARTGKYDDGKRIPGARSLAPDTSSEAAAKLIPSKSSLVVTYCSNLQCPASRMLAKRLAELGYSNILEYPNGIAGWIEAGNKVEKAK